MLYQLSYFPEMVLIMIRDFPAFGNTKMRIAE